MSSLRRRRTTGRKRSGSLVWYAVIALVIVLLGAVLGLQGGLIDFIDRHFSVSDRHYTPMDLERKEAMEQREKAMTGGTAGKAR